MADVCQGGRSKISFEITVAGIRFRQFHSLILNLLGIGKLPDNQQIPFMPDAPSPFTVDDKNLAETRRFSGRAHGGVVTIGTPVHVEIRQDKGGFNVRVCTDAIRYHRVQT